MERTYTTTSDTKFFGEDVYSGITSPYSATTKTSTDTTSEFSLADIQAKLGIVTDVANKERTADPDVLPSHSTLQMSYAREYQKQTQAGTKVSTRTKVMVASYVTVVLALVLAVTLCSVSVAGSFQATTQLKAELGAVSTQLEQLREQLSVEDYEALSQKAESLGYYYPTGSNTQTYTELETRPAQNFDIQTNWFDSLCDWISSVFGG